MSPHYKQKTDLNSIKACPFQSGIASITLFFFPKVAARCFMENFVANSEGFNEEQIRRYIREQEGWDGGGLF